MVGNKRISTPVTRMDQVTQSNAANAEESASEELNAQAEESSIPLELKKNWSTSSEIAAGIDEVPPENATHPANSRQ